MGDWWESDSELQSWNASQMTPYMFVGSVDDAHYLEGLRENGITHILNVADDAENLFEDSGEFVYCNLNVKDFGEDIGISRVFPEAVEFVRTLLSGSDNKVLIHCVHGMSRDPSVSIAILMNIESISLREAWTKVITARKCAAPELSNRTQLILHEQQLFQQNSITDPYEFFRIYEQVHNPGYYLIKQAMGGK